MMNKEKRMTVNERVDFAGETRRRVSRWISGLVLACGVIAAPFAQASDLKVGQFKLGKDDLVMRGDGKCTTCHDMTDKYGEHILAIQHTKHAVAADGRTPSCQSCHGESEDHMKKRVGEGKDARRMSPDVVFGAKSKVAAKEQNARCLNCHESRPHIAWRGSTHDNQNVSCVSCHTLHTAKDKVMDKKTQPEVCYECHKDRRIDMLKPSAHPVKSGKMACSSCHNPHGGNGVKNLIKPTINETCWTCHAEKRGPFLWEHAPVRDNCVNCHDPHGSIHGTLLKMRNPWLCQQCHSHNAHPSGVYSGTNYISAQQVRAKGCINCHSQIHGSNHPSGPRFTR